MPTETRLLYILSDLAYIAKLNPTKKAHEFAISDFHQLNGQFLDENSLIEKNIKKLVDKLEAGTYQLILPDFLFTNTMVNVAVKTEAEVKDYLNEHLLADLKIDKEDYYLHTSVLSNYGGAFKVQLTALEKGIVLPLVKALKNNQDVIISAIAPLSFSIKSLISLEPSVSILQIERQLYLAQHYIGVDQCFNTEIDNANDFAETVKTLKGVEPSLQTLYLLSDALVDSKIKEVLANTLPVQQLAEISAEGDKIPSFIKKIIEAGAKTFAVPDYLLPQFAIDKKYDKELEIKTDKDDTNEEDLLISNITKPAVVGEESTDENTPESEEIMPKDKELKKPEKIEQKTEEQEENIQTDMKNETLPTPKTIDLSEINEVINEDKVEKVSSDETAKAKDKAEAAEIDLAQFTNLAIDPSVLNKKGSANVNDKEASAAEIKPVIKNSAEGKSVLKMILISLFSFIITVGIGLGIGYGIWQLSNKKAPESQTGDQPSDVLAEVTPSPEPEPVVINKEDYLLLVVNATTQAGYAGKIANDLEEAGFVDVAAKNASGDYEVGNYLLLSDLSENQEASNQALLKEIKDITELEWELSDQITTEDSEGSYQAVLVLAE